MKRFSVITFLIAFAGLFAQASAALADGGAKFLGNITTSSEIRSDMGTYWNQITNENGCKWKTIHSIDDKGNSIFDFDGFDSCKNGYEWAKAEPGRTFKFHSLIWGSQKPDFLCTKKNPGINKEKTLRYITEWFDAVAKQFPDLEYIEVVNEAIWDGDNYHSDYSMPAQDAESVSTDELECGGSYIIPALGGDDVVNGKHQYNFVQKAFEMARERWPKAKLIYNDFNTLTYHLNEGVEMIQTLVENGTPIDFYGLQAHDCKGMGKAEFESKLTRIHNETDLPLLISEYDIGEADDEKQKNEYANHIPFMWETPWIGGVTIWGYIKDATWAANTGIVNSDGTKRSAMVWLEQYFATHLTDGANSFGIEPVPQSPYGGVAWAIPGKIEAEDFDVPGVGAGNDSYFDTDSDNRGDSDYRKADAPAVDLYKRNEGIVVGYIREGEWLEYTVNVAESGEYTVFISVTSSGGSSLALYVDGERLTDDLTIPANRGDDWEDYYSKIYTRVSLSAGMHILRLEATDNWFDFDFMTFVAIDDVVDPDPLVGPASSSSTVVPASSSSSGVAQQPFGGVASRIPGVIEAEDFDIPGIGSGNEAFYDVDDRNFGDSDYRIDLGVDLCERNSGIVVCRTEKDEWLEYTVNVTETGYYTFNASVSASAYGTGFRLKQGGSYITDFISVPYSEEEASSKFVNVKADLFLEAGTQTFRLVVMNGGFDIDYMIFVAQSSFGGVTTVKSPVENGMDLQEYDVFDMQGVRVERISANGMKNASSVVQNRLAARAGGVYLLRACKTGEMQTIRIAK